MCPEDWDNLGLRNPSPDAKPIFQRITEAYSILSDDKKRLKYDKSGDMDLEDFDIDQFLNMWVGEMMEDGGVVDDMMQAVLPWRSDEEKMMQFMEENVAPSGGKLQCKVCQHVGSNQRLMLAHFEKKHHLDCEEWAKETLKSMMKASFESFMKQVTGLGDPSGEFLMPDGSKAEMSKVPGVPDIRAHMQKRMDKAKVLEQVLEMYRTVAAEEVEDSEAAASSPDEVRMAKAKATPERIAEVLDVTLEEAQRLKDDREELLRQLKMRIDELSAEDEEEELLESMAAFGGGMDGADFGLGGFGPGGLGGLEDLQDLLQGDPQMEALLGQLGGGLPFGGPMGMPGMPGFRQEGAQRFARSSQDGYERFERPARRRTPPQEQEEEIGCICGYTCGTEKALQRHLDRFPSDAAHRDARRR
ncbi:unnamed protein product [Durusdinium trenchii]|uniref:J domain-containing protein n=1 Tax=Durusdinium trenchii TaxID=1381693 RepID=A0ABP0ITH8_9DINO